MQDAGLPSVTTPLERMEQAGAASLVGAALMLFFGFGYLARPDGDDWFSKAGLVTYHTLRIGGVLLVVVGLLLRVKWAPALMIDSALAVPTGVILGVCGIVMLLDGGHWLNSVILVACGGSFLTSGLRNGREYLLHHRRPRNI